MISHQSKEWIDEVDYYLKKIFPITRSITGPGNRETLKILQKLVSFEIKEYCSGASVYDWTIPDEWRVRDAWIKDANGNKLIEFQQCNIHLVSYSKPVHKKIAFSELKTHLHYDKTLPDAIPYRTTYYKKDWGFCVNREQYQTLSKVDGKLEIMIDSEFDSQGSLTIGEMLIPGRSEQEILISTYFCHPSLANDNLSGLVMTTLLARELSKRNDLKWSYRIVWVPETIGAIAYCAMNEAAMKKIDMGLVVTTVGGPGPFGYKQSWQSGHPINRMVEEVFNEANKEFIKYPFDVHGSDERQYSSQGFRINIATISKDKYYNYPEYHTSFDDLSLVNGQQISEAFDLYIRLINKMEDRCIFKSTVPYCEVMLSRHNLYPTNGGMQKPELGGKSELDIILWLLFYCDGKKSINDIAIDIGVKVSIVQKLCSKLEKNGVIVKV